MSERGQGIRLFSSEAELTEIFEAWDPESDGEEDEDEEEDGEEGDETVRSDAGSDVIMSEQKVSSSDENEKSEVTAS